MHWEEFEELVEDVELPIESRRDTLSQGIESMSRELIILELLRDFRDFFGDFHDCCTPDPFGNVAMDPVEYESCWDTYVTAALTPPRDEPAVIVKEVAKPAAKPVDNSRQLAQARAAEKRKLKESRARERELEKKRRKKHESTPRPRANADEVFQYVNAHANSNFWRSLKKFATIEIGPTPIPAKRFVQKPGKSQNYWLTVLKWASSGRSNEWHSRGKMEEVFGKELYHCCRLLCEFQPLVTLFCLGRLSSTSRIPTRRRPSIRRLRLVKLPPTTLC
jgi:hypothetical protein